MGSDNKLFFFLDARLFKIELSRLDCVIKLLEIVPRPLKVLVEFLLAELLCLETRYRLTMDSFILFDPCGMFLLNPGTCLVEMPGADGREILFEYDPVL